MVMLTFEYRVRRHEIIWCVQGHTVPASGPNGLASRRSFLTVGPPTLGGPSPSRGVVVEDSTIRHSGREDMIYLQCREQKFRDQDQNTMDKDHHHGRIVRSSTFHQSHFLHGVIVERLPFVAVPEKKEPEGCNRTVQLQITYMIRTHKV